MALELIFSCPLRNGLHARPASALEEVVRNFAAEFTLLNRRTGQSASMRSVLSMIGTDVRFEDECRITIDGADEREALAVLGTFLKTQFPHCDDGEPGTETPLVESNLPACLRESGATLIRGQPVVGGIGRGRIIRVSGVSERPLNQGSGPAITRGDHSSPAAEQSRIEQALAQLAHSFEDRLRQSSNSTESAILKVHLAIARDPDFKTQLFNRLRGCNGTAETALNETEAHFASMLNASGSVMLGERALDVRDVCAQLGRIFRGETARTDLVGLNDATILVADDLTPNQLLQLDRKFLKGLALSHAGSTSHTVILARSFDIPTLAGVLAAGLRQGEEAVLDAEIGALVTHLTPAAARYYHMEERRIEGRRSRLRQSSRAPATTRDGVSIEIAANVSSSQEVASAVAAGADSIGLFRTEALFLERTEPPAEEEQFAAYRQALEEAEGRTVIIRTLDIGGDKRLPYLNVPKEENPFLGRRGVRLYPQIENIFRAQLRALLRASPHGKLKIMIPMITAPSEATWVRHVVTEEAALLSEAGISYDSQIAVGGMIEVPSAAFSMESLSRDLDFFSIGSNDLIHYFTATDRLGSQAQSLTQPTSPAFLRLMKWIANEAADHNKWLGLCGEMGAEVEMLPLLVGLGLNEISVAAPAIARIKSAITSLLAADCAALLAEALRCGTPEEVRSLQGQWRSHHLPPLIEEDLMIMETESDASTKAEAIKELCDRLHVTGRSEAPREVEEAVWKREMDYPTGFGNGFAIPHCKTDAVTANSLAVLKLRQPVVWGSSDGEPVNFVILLAIRDSEAATTHLKVFSHLARQLMHEDFREELILKKAAPDLVNFLRERIEINVADSPLKKSQPT